MRLVLIHNWYKSYVGLWFYQGVFLKDTAKQLINAQEGKTKGLRQWRCTSADEIDKNLVLVYVEEAIQNQKDGKEIKPEKAKELVIPSALSLILDSDRDLRNCFQKLTIRRIYYYCKT